MPVSWDPNFSDGARSGSGDLTIFSPSLFTTTPGAGYDVVALAIIGSETDDGSGTITDLGGMTQLIELYEDGNDDYATRLFMLARQADDSDIVLGVAGLGAAAVAGFFPMAVPSWLEPHSSTPVPGEGENYSNPMEWNNQPTDPIVAWIPAPIGYVQAGGFFSFSSGGDSISTFAASSPEAETDLSFSQTITQGSVKARVSLIALERATEDPAEFHINPAGAAEHRWLAWVGGEGGGGWVIGSPAW